MVNYLGTDTIEAIRWAKHNYGKIATGYSVFATEHSTTTIYTKNGESSAYTHFLNVVPDDKIASIVIDSYDTENAVVNLLGGKLKSKILSRKAPTVFRPDSGDPIEMSLKVVNWLWTIFGGTINSKGFKVLNSLVRVIYGDGVNLNSIDAICANLIKHGFSTENIIFGMGGKLLQGVDRDTFMDACKVCYAIVDGVGVDIYKDPITDTGKKSKRGLQKVIKSNGEFKTVRLEEYPECPDQLRTVFENGILYNEITFDQVRKNASEN